MFSAKKMAKTATARCVPALDDTYPNVQKILALLIDFESCDRSEEPQTTHLPLSRGPFVLREERGLEMLFPLSPRSEDVLSTGGRGVSSVAISVTRPT